MVPRYFEVASWWFEAQGENQNLKKLSIDFQGPAANVWPLVLSWSICGWAILGHQ